MQDSSSKSPTLKSRRHSQPLPGKKQRVRKIVYQDGILLSPYEMRKQAALLCEVVGCQDDDKYGLRELLQLEKSAPAIVADEVANRTNLGDALSRLIAGYISPAPVVCKFCLQETDVACVGKNCGGGVHYNGPDHSKLCGSARPKVLVWTARTQLEDNLCYTCLLDKIVCRTCSKSYTSNEVPIQCAHPECTRYSHAQCTDYPLWKRFPNAMHYCPKHDCTQVRGADCATSCKYTEMPDSLAPSEFVQCGGCHKAVHALVDTGFVCGQLFSACLTCHVTCDNAVLMCSTCSRSKQRCHGCGSGPRVVSRPQTFPEWLEHRYVEGAMYQCHACNGLYHDDDYCKRKMMVATKDTGAKVVICESCKEEKHYYEKYVLDPEYEERARCLREQCRRYNLLCDGAGTQASSSSSSSSSGGVQIPPLECWYKSFGYQMQRHYLAGCNSVTLEQVVKAKLAYVLYHAYYPWSSFEVHTQHDRNRTFRVLAANRIPTIEEDVITRLGDAMAVQLERARANNDENIALLHSPAFQQTPWLPMPGKEHGISPENWREVVGFSRDYALVSPPNLLQLNHD